MDEQVVVITIGPNLNPQIEKIVQNHYSHDLDHYYKTTIIRYLQSNYIILVFYNML